MASPREHVEEIRRKKFSIGGEENPLTEDLHHAVKNLSAELYAKDVHFLMELIQNAEDNEYSASVDPSLEFVITSNDITATGAPATLLIFNNEIGFSPKNIDSICSVGRSTKKGNRKKGYIGEKGIGFKSVFLITSRPYIFSNGYQIRFNEEPCQHCNVGYIVPEWVDQNPNVSEIRQIYGSSGDSLPTTILILPLKPDKVGPVRRQLSSIHPEVLLFLSKIKALSIREQNEETVNGVAITKETDFKQRKSMDAESFTLHLNADEDGSAKECSFYMWKQRFPVPSDCRVEKRSEVDEWAITLAFPTNGDRLWRNKGSASPGIYAFLPTEMVTNFPFVIQADFLLASSRETILLDQEWNRGILRCVSEAFVNAFKSLVEAHRDAPAWILPETFRFLPVEDSNYKELNVVRESIRTRLAEEEVVPSEAVVRQNFLHKPREVGRLDKSFWAVLDVVRAEGVKLPGLSSHGKYVLSSPLDREEYDRELEFLGVKPVEPEWYAKCIKGCNLVEKVSDRVYLEILSFVAENWKTKFLRCPEIKDVPLVKYQKDQNETVVFLTMSGSAASTVYLSRHLKHVKWMIGWSGEFLSATGIFFVPNPTHEAMEKCPKKEALLLWLKEEAKVRAVDVDDFASLVSQSISVKKDRRLVVGFAHFLHHCVTSKGFLTVTQARQLCKAMPVVDSYGYVNTERKGLLVPRSGSKWAELVLSNVWSQDGYVELSEDYLAPFRVAGKLVTKENELLSFLGEQARAEDVPHIPIPHSRISVSSSLTKENAYMLLEWIRSQNLRRGYVPIGFLATVKEGSWLRITTNGSPGSRPPSQSFLLGASDSSWGDLLQNKSVFVDVPLVDRSFYGKRIDGYKAELKVVGVMSEYSEACRFVGDRLMSLADSGALTRTNVLSILRFIRFLGQILSPDDFIKTVKKRKWVRTSRGDKSPAETVLFDEKWKTVAKISDIPFIDLDFYGEEIREFGNELALLGVVVGFSGDAECYKLVVENLKPSPSLSSLPADALLLALRCIRKISSNDRVVKALKGTKCVRTSVGYKAPEEVFLCDPEWSFLFQVFDGLPMIDPDFYGKTLVNLKVQLKQIGVTVDFDQAAKAFADHFNDRARKKSVSNNNAVAFLGCFRRLKQAGLKFPTELKKCFYETKWLRTRHCDYYRSPRECVLFGPEWKLLSPVARLPFLDDTDTDSGYGCEIHKYKKELNALGVVTKLDDGVKFVAEGLYFHSIELIGAETVLALLDCVAVLCKQDYEFPPELVLKLSQPWLRTSSGYKSPNECLFFDSGFEEYLEETDGPFLDRDFYGPRLSSYREVLRFIGVVVDVGKGCELIAGELESQSEFSTVARFYTYLSRFHWKPNAESEKKIWIPNGNLDGDWASPERCVVSDETGLFGSQLSVLDEHYEGNHLSFFSTAFRVKSSPRTEDYRELWKTWEILGRVLSHDECCKFWSYMAENLTPELERTFAAELEKVPVKLGRRSDDAILLVDKKDVFIADDLQLKDCFEKSGFGSLFVWYPQPSPPTLPRTKLLQLFQKLGVRTISESVVRREEKPILQRNILPGCNEPSSLIGKGLARLVLGFLAAGIETEDNRHRALGDLLKLSVVGMEEPIEVHYDLSLSSGKAPTAMARRTVKWERKSSTIFTTSGGDMAPGQVIERATCFSEVVAEVVLWESGERVRELAELIRLAFLMEFHDDAIEFLMTSNNLQTFVEDDEFLASAFPVL